MVLVRAHQNWFKKYRSVLEIIMKYLVKLFFEFNIWESQQELVTVRG